MILTQAASADLLLDDLNDAQRAAVVATSGPLVILAGAGTGKTRVISRRAAYAIQTQVVVPAAKVLLVTFTDKAANEMVDRMAALGHSGVMARTFHSHAVRQLRHFWPSRHGGEDPPQILDSKLPIIRPLAQRLPGHYRFTPTKDIADAIEWAKVRRIPPERWEQEAPERAPIPADLFARLYADYERAKDRAKRVDFEDMLALTVHLLESDADAARIVQTQKTWISVDEYQDTDPLQERLLELWIGASRDLAVVGDPDQTIYTQHLRHAPSEPCAKFVISGRPEYRSVAVVAREYPDAALRHVGSRESRAKSSQARRFLRGGKVGIRGSVGVDAARSAPLGGGGQGANDWLVGPEPRLDCGPHAARACHPDHRCQNGTRYERRKLEGR